MADLNAISLYTGAGGMDFGVEAAGFRIRAGLEIDKDCCDTLRANSSWPLIQKDIAQVPSLAILRTGSVSAGSVDLVFGGPPCQPFSKAGYWTNGDTRRLSDPRARTLHEFMRVVGDLRPTVFLLENVHGIAYSGKEEGFQFLRKMTEKINRKHGTSYQLSWKVLDAANYGVPQLRSRFFLVGSADGKPFRFPSPTHSARAKGEDGAQRTLEESTVDPAVTAWDALADCPSPREDEDLSPKGCWARLLPSIPEGHNYLWHTDHGGGEPLFGWRTRYWSFLLKLAKARPSWTIPAQPGPAIGPFHWANRYLSTQELAALQTFPKGLMFVGGRGSVQRQLGNAVPSLMAEVLTREIGRQLLGARLSKNLRLSVRLHRPIPQPETVAPVPEEYLELRGHHAPHPGTSRGPRGRFSDSPSRKILPAVA